ncbi:MAG: putative bacterial non-heme ferritin [Anaerolineales bacterium]|nr:putative bacterial non-heme ferritin [Anaerolineales bacterium]
MNKALRDAMNDQVRNEFHSAYIYFSMAAYCESINMPGFAHWLYVQSQEEIEHAMKFFDHLNERGERVALQAIEQPPTEFDSLLEIAQAAYGQEQTVTGQINDIYDIAVEEKDYPAQALLQWFAMEQVEEEDTTSQLVERLKMVGDEPAALVMLDRELAGRQPEEEE